MSPGRGSLEVADLDDDDEEEEEEEESDDDVRVLASARCCRRRGGDATINIRWEVGGGCVTQGGSQGGGCEREGGAVAAVPLSIAPPPTIAIATLAVVGRQ